MRVTCAVAVKQKTMLFVYQVIGVFAIDGSFGRIDGSFGAIDGSFGRTPFNTFAPNF